MSKNIKLNSKIWLPVLIILGISTGLMAQNKKKAETLPVHGIVMTQSGQPISGVVISADEGKSQFTTDVDGKFSFNATANSRFLFEHSDYHETLVSLDDLKNMDFNIILSSRETIREKNTMVELPFRTKEKYRIVGNVDIIDAEREYNRDSRTAISSAVEGKVSGSLGGMNLNGLGGAFTVVDGIPMGTGYIMLQEVEQIVVLKDAISRLLYGVETDIPIVLITTKKGKANKKDLQFFAEHGVKQALAYPKFLDAASYMETYNQAFRNDGGTTDYYSNDFIRNTRDGIDQVFYPDNDYYSSSYIKDITNFTHLFGTVSGGNEKTRYLLNLDWTNSPGWYQMRNTMNNDLRLRGRVDFEVTRWLKMNSSILASYTISNGPRLGNYWTKANTRLPNAFPELIPVSRISNLESLGNYSLVDGTYLLGGTSIYQNTMYGDILKNGTQSQVQRYVQSRTGFDLDLSGITRGLSSHGAVGFDFFNEYQQIINNTYSVYEVGTVDEEGNFPVTQIGVDKVTTEQTINSGALGINRSIKWYYTLNYDRTFGPHAISAVGVGYGSFYDENNLAQPPRKIAFGSQASYMFSDKYIVEGALLAQTSMKVKPSKRLGFSKSAAAAWIMSNEGFLKENSLISFLKLRAGYGQFISDVFTSGSYNGYFLNEDIYSQSYVFQYNNGLLSNRQISIDNLDNQIDWERRNELSVGLDVALLKDQLGFEVTWFDSYSFDNVTGMNVLSPSTIGGVTSYANYNANDFQGVNIGLKADKKIGDLSIDLAAYYTTSWVTVKKIAENKYVEPGNVHLSKVNNDARGMWGLTAERLYLASDFDTEGELLPEIPVPAWGKVKPGDIKYQDYNRDGLINDDDQTVIGRNSNNNLIALNIDLKYKQWELFLLPMLSWGGQGYNNSGYYWFQGNSAKYSVVALEAFDENNPNPQATYPRLSLGSSANNYRNSTFWMYRKSYCSLTSAQISYSFMFRNNSVIRQMRLYARGNDLFMLAKDKDVLQLNFGSAPQSRIVSLGVMVTF